MISTQWREHRAQPAEGQLLVVGDVHGRAGALARLLDHLHALPSWGAWRDLVFLGDLIDRGPASLRALHLAWDARGEVDDWSLLPGNHELMLLDALDEAEALEEAQGERSRSDTPTIRMWLANGGTSLLREVDPERQLAPLDALHALRRALPAWFEPAVRQDPTHLTVGGFLLVHAGINPHEDQATFLSRPRWLAEGNHWAWIREPFLTWRHGWGEDGRQIVVHGHTPATMSPIHTAQEASALLDRIDTHGRLCLDAGAAALDQVAAIEITGERYRFHIASSHQGSAT